MKIFLQYLDRNKLKVNELFENNSKDKQLPATKVFAFLQQLTTAHYISFSKDGKEFFKNEDNQSYIEKLVEKHYKSTPDGRSAKFFLYRIKYSYEQLLQFLQFWLKKEKSITISDPLYKQQSQSSSSPSPSPLLPPPQKSKPQAPENIAVPVKKQEQMIMPAQLRESAIIDNQFLREEEKKNMLIAAYQGEIKKTEELLLKTTQGGEQEKQIQKKIQLLKSKILSLTQGILLQNNTSKDQSPIKNSEVSPRQEKSKTEVSRYKKEINFKQIFQFYAKQNHLTGVKASFERIEHQSQTVNYQKLVHFLKEYDIFPQHPKQQKKLQNVYVRICSNTRDLHFNEFMELLQKLPQILFLAPQLSLQQKKQMMINKMQSRSQKTKVLHNPFHSLQKSDFRINSQGIKYEFKLKPLKGKLQVEVNYQLQNRKKIKQETKLQVSKEKEQKQLKKLKKLKAIDPYHPLVVKKASLLQQRSHSVLQSPIANLDNMQKFRDAKFDMKAMFGISDFGQDPLKQMHRYDMDKRAQMIEREQTLKMSNLMSGLIERSQAKLVKLGLSPRKRLVSSRVN